jgi:hypothetical protein
MSNVIKFPLKQEETYLIDQETINTEYAYIGDDLVKKPTNTREYLDLCKSKLTEEDYRDVLCGIMDLEYYTQLDKAYKGIVDVYYAFLKI